jgi:hypothetical protein
LLHGLGTRFDAKLMQATSVGMPGMSEGFHPKAS